MFEVIGRNHFQAGHAAIAVGDFLYVFDPDAAIVFHGINLVVPYFTHALDFAADHHIAIGNDGFHTVSFDRESDQATSSQARNIEIIDIFNSPTIFSYSRACKSFFRSKQNIAYL